MCLNCNRDSALCLMHAKNDGYPVLIWFVFPRSHIVSNARRSNPRELISFGVVSVLDSRFLHASFIGTWISFACALSVPVSIQGMHIRQLSSIMPMLRIFLSVYALYLFLLLLSFLLIHGDTYMLMNSPV